MDPLNLLPFDPAIIPWETHPNAWALCLTIEPESRIWVERELIRAMLEHGRLDQENLANIHGMLIAIGGKVAATMDRVKIPLENGKVRAIKFTGNPVIMRVGRFGDETFVFLPRPEFERDEAPPEFPGEN